MMVWLKEIRGQKVIFEGKCIGRIVQGMLCDSLTALDGLWVDRAIRGMRFISAEHICVFGKNSVTVDHPGERLRMKPKNMLIRAVSTDGTRLGAVVDAAIDEKLLTVCSLALNPGWIDLLLTGHRNIDLYRHNPSSAKVIVLEDGMEVEP